MRTRTIPFRKPAAAAILAAASLAAPALGADKFWDTSTSANLQAGNGIWDTGTTTLWSDVAAGSNPLVTWADNDNAHFRTTGSNSVNLNFGTVQVSLLQNNVNSTTAGTTTSILDGTIQINANTGIVNQAASSTGTLTFGALTTLTLNSANVAMTANQNVFVNGAIGETGGARAITKGSTGTLSLSGANSWTGGTTISAGLLSFGATSTVPATGNFTINAGGTLAASGPAAFNTVNEWLGSGRIVTTSGGAIGITGANSEAIDLTGFPNLFLGSTVVATYSGALTPGANGYRLGGFSTTTFNQSLNAATTLTTSGNTVILTAANGYTGATSVTNASVLRISNAGALGTNSAVSVADGARLELAGGITVTGKNITISGAGGNNMGALQTQAGDNIWTGSILIGNSTARVGLAAGNLTLSGVIDDGASTFALRIRNANGSTGAVTVSNPANTYNGNTEIVVGNLKVGANNALAQTQVILGNASAQGSAALDLNGFSQTTTAVTTIASNNIPVRVINSSATAATLTINAAAATSTAGSGATQVVVLGNTGQDNFSLVKTGAGTLTLPTGSTFSGGTTLSGGSISISASGALGVGNVTVANTATSLIVPGLGVNAVADTATLSLAGGGTPGVADMGFFSLVSGANETVGGLILNGVPQANGTYGPTGSGADNINDEFFSGGGIVTVVPEPASAMLLAWAGLLLFRRRGR